MAARKDAPIDKTFGRLTVLREVEPRQFPTRAVRQVECKCECGNVLTVILQNLMSGTSRSCGCTGGNFKHGHSVGRYNGGKDTPTYSTWRAMWNRCLNPKHSAYERYGATGVTVCDRWLGVDGFKNFLADMGERPDGMTLDRKRNEEGYSPDNCRWATNEEQFLNKRVLRRPDGRFSKEQ